MLKTLGYTEIGNRHNYTGKQINRPIEVFLRSLSSFKGILTSGFFLLINNQYVGIIQGKQVKYPHKKTTKTVKNGGAYFIYIKFE